MDSASLMKGIYFRILGFIKSPQCAPSQRQSTLNYKISTKQISRSTFCHRRRKNLQLSQQQIHNSIPEHGTFWTYQHRHHRTPGLRVMVTDRFFYNDLFCSHSWIASGEISLILLTASIVMSRGRLQNTQLTAPYTHIRSSSRF